MIVFQMSDIHFGAQDEDALRAAERLIDTACPDALIVCGDLTQRGKRVEFRAARRWLDQFGLPSLVVAGNHDTPLLNLVQRVASPFQRFEDMFDDYLRPIEIGSWRFVGLNTARGWQARRNWAEGVVDLEALETAASSGSKTAIVCHHPFVSPPNTPLRTRTKRGADADTILKNASASLLMCGHVHAPTAEHRRGTSGSYLALTAGTLSTRLRDAPPSINKLTLSHDGMDIVAIPCTEAVSPQPLGTFSVPMGTKDEPTR